MEEINYYQEFVKEYKEIRKKEENKPKLLLHVCCAACLAYPLVFLSSLFDITIYYSNSNIYPKEEYEKRIYYVKKYVNDILPNLNKKIDIIEDNYNYDEFKKDLEPYSEEKEGGNRCKICISKRLVNLFEYAKNNNYKYVMTIMSISRNKDAIYINKTGKLLEQKYKNEGYNITYIYEDFKKNNGQEIGIKIAKQYNIYRQDYCGCEFSLKNKDIFKENNEIDNKFYEISVIVPIHGVDEYIEECLSSLKDQDIKVNYEVLCLLDSPNKKEKEIVEEYCKKYPNLFKMLLVNFKDVSLVRNYGLKYAKGRYIGFVDGDDYVKNNYLSLFYNKAIKENADIVVGKYYRLEKNKLRLPDVAFIPSFYYENKKNYDIEKTRIRTSKGLRNDVFIRGYLWNKFYKKEFIINNNLSFLSISVCIEDMFFNYLAFLYSSKTTFINNRTYIYRIRSGSYVTKDPIKVAQKYINNFYLYKYVAIHEFNNKKLGNAPYRRMGFSLMLEGIKHKDMLDISLFNYIKMVYRQMKKLKKNTYIHEGDEWEKAVYLYIKNKEESIYKK